jgi:prepilin-type processing-associated H-X9-DG protein
MNAFVGQWTQPSDSLSNEGRNAFQPDYRQFLKRSSIPNPNRTFLFVDEHADSINDGSFLTNPSGASNWGDVPGSYHNGGCNFSFADGHAELRVWQFARTRIPVSFAYRSVSIPASEAGDYQWVAQRASVHFTTLGATPIPGNRLQIVWSALPTNYVLQATDTLGGGNWSDVRMAPVKESGQNSVQIDAPARQEYFRLIRR